MESFATFAYSMIHELRLHPRPMVSKSISLLFGQISRKFKKKAAVPPFVLSILAQFISESFETNLYFSKKNPLDFAFDNCNI